MAKYALVVGIDDYTILDPTGGTNLSACVADADSLYHLLIEALGFPRENVRLLKDSQATWRNILSSITYLFSQAEAGDTVFFSYSGHGALFPATTAPDNIRFYQSLVPYDDIQIYDFDLHRATLNAGFNPSEVNFTCFFDSCHSGGMHPTVNSEQTIPRSIPFRTDVANDLQSIQELWPIGICMPNGVNELFPNVSNPRIENNVLVDLDEDPNKNFVASAQATLISACKYYEVAGEDSQHGYLTKALLDFVNTSNPQVSYDQLIDELVTRVLQYSGNNQHPTLRGQLGRMDHPFLEGWNTSI